MGIIYLIARALASEPVLVDSERVQIADPSDGAVVRREHVPAPIQRV